MIEWIKKLFGFGEVKVEENPKIEVRDYEITEPKVDVEKYRNQIRTEMEKEAECQTSKAFGGVTYAQKTKPHHRQRARLDRIESARRSHHVNHCGNDDSDLLMGAAIGMAVASSIANDDSQKLTEPTRSSYDEDTCNSNFSNSWSEPTSNCDFGSSYDSGGDSGGGGGCD